MTKLKIFLITIGVLGIGAIAVAGISQRVVLGDVGDKLGEAVGLGANPVISGEPVDLIGTKVGTTVTPLYFHNNFTSSTTYPVRIGQQAESVIFTLNATASNTPRTYFSILASNDTDCDTATTTTIYNVTTTGQINWFDASNFILNAAGARTISSGTSTIAWDHGIYPISNRTIVLDNVNAECLALQVAASSTKLWVQVKTKATSGY